MDSREAYWGRLSVGLAIVFTLFILNFFLGIIPTSFQGLPVLISPIIGFIGMMLGIDGLSNPNDRLARIGIMFNVILIIFPFAYWILGTLIWGP